MKIAITLVLLISFSFGQDIRDKVRKGNKASKETRIIDPNDSIFGFEIGMTEDELIKVKGKPMGYVRLNDKNSALFFDSNVSFIFTDGKLSGVTVGMSLIDHQIKEYFTGKMDYRRGDWKLDNGIREDMSLEDVKKILDGELRKSGTFPSEYRQYYEDGDSEVHLSFASRTINGGERRYMVHAVMVVPK